MGCGCSDLDRTYSDARISLNPRGYYEYHNLFDDLPGEVERLSARVDFSDPESMPDEEECDISDIAPLICFDGSGDADDEAEPIERVVSYCESFKRNRPPPTKLDPVKHLYPPVNTRRIEHEIQESSPLIQLIGTSDFDFMLVDDRFLDSGSDDSITPRNCLVRRTESIATADDPLYSNPSVLSLGENLNKIASKTNEELKSTQTKDELLPVISSFISSVLSNSIDQLEIEQESGQSLSMMHLSKSNGTFDLASLLRCDLNSDNLQMERYELLNNNFNKRQISVI